jgi:hypothetical protein
MRIAILLALAAYGCTQTTYLTKPDLNEGTYAQDSRECRQQGEESAFYNCMRGKGYTVQTGSQTRVKTYFTTSGR